MEKLFILKNKVGKYYETMSPIGRLKFSDTLSGAYMMTAAELQNL